MIRKALDLDRKQRTQGDELVLDGDQDNSSYVDSLGWVLFRRGELAEARRSWSGPCRCKAVPTRRRSGTTWATFISAPKCRRRRATPGARPSAFTKPSAAGPTTGCLKSKRNSGN